MIPCGQGVPLGRAADIGPLDFSAVDVCHESVVVAYLECHVVELVSLPSHVKGNAHVAGRMLPIHLGFDIQANVRFIS